MKFEKLSIFVGGFALGTAGLKLLTSKDAKKCYTHATAAVLRAKDCVMATVNKAKENVDDIVADANDINDQRYFAEDEFVEDIACEECCKEAECDENCADATV